MKKENLKKSYEKHNLLVKLFKVLSNSNRLKIAKFLLDCGKKGATVSEIEKAIGISQSNLSNHLKLMRIAKVLAAKQQNTNMYYSIKEPLVISLIASLE